MTRDQQLELIRRKCIEANFGIQVEASYCLACEGNPCQSLTVACPMYAPRPIRLADVLLAIMEVDVEKAFPTENYPATKIIAMIVGRWNLRKDDLTEQSDECVAFLAQLLG